MSEMLEAAQAHALAGRAGFPLAESSKVPKIAKSAGGRGFLDATIDLGQITQWLTRWKRANWGLRTGSVSGFWVLDVDINHRGFESLEALETKYGRLPVTLAVRTPSGGRHYYFTWPGVELRCSASVLDDGLDIRAEGGYVATWPSVIARVGAYELEQDRPIVAAPSWLVRKLRKPQRPPEPEQTVYVPAAGVAKLMGSVLEDRARRVASAPVSRRNTILNAEAFYLGTFVGAGMLDSMLVYAALGAAARSAGLDEREIRMTIASALSAGIASPKRWSA